MRELQDQLEAEQYFSTLYKTQVTELREEVDEKTRQVKSYNQVFLLVPVISYLIDHTG